MDKKNISLLHFFLKKEFTTQDLFICAFRENFWN